MQGKVYVVIGGNYGSESKGLVCVELMKERGIKNAVRTGSINAGHTVPFEGKLYKNQQIPVGWVVRDAKLFIGAGAYVSPEILDREIKMIEEATGESLKDRLFIDKRCGSHLAKHKEAEQGAKLHEKMGSTGEGVAESAIEKMKRGDDYLLFKDTDYADQNDGLHFTITDTVKMLNQIYDEGGLIMLEGTQGALLDMHLGFYPYVTSRQTNAATWMAEAGLSPNCNKEIVMVCRTYPIRVAGNSGPMADEIDWYDLAKEMNQTLVAQGKDPIIKDFALSLYRGAVIRLAHGAGIQNTEFHTWTPQMRKEHSEFLVNIHQKVMQELPPKTVEELKALFEMTTVTKKLRRIAELNIDDLKYAVSINRPDYIVMNFMNYVFPTLYGYTNPDTPIGDLPEYADMMEYLSNIEGQIQTPIRYVNYNPFFIKQVK
jgi:adenylosuccinate synthase